MRKKRQAGFTLIELMIVISIIAIVASIAIPNLLAAKLVSNETAAMATLKALTTAQQMVQSSTGIDTDGDGTGEFGTFLELSAAAGVRRAYTPGPPGSSTFAPPLGPKLYPAPLSASLSMVDGTGYVTKAGYAFMVFLPDATPVALWVHEVNSGTPTAPVPALSVAGSSLGGTTSIGVNLSEFTWCAYAQPVTRNVSGNRCFFVNVAADIINCPNLFANHAGTATAIDPRSALRLGGAGITAAVAIGTLGNDGEVWRSN